MKTKKLSKKLALNKRSIAALNVKDMVFVKGGDSLGRPSCEACQTVHICTCIDDESVCYSHPGTWCSFYICP